MPYQARNPRAQLERGKDKILWPFQTRAPELTAFDFMYRYMYEDNCPFLTSSFIKSLLSTNSLKVLDLSNTVSI
jgi:hypothetical protein